MAHNSPTDSLPSSSLTTTAHRSEMLMGCPTLQHPDTSATSAPHWLLIQHSIQGCALPEHLQIKCRGPESRGYTPSNSLPLPSQLQGWQEVPSPPLSQGESSSEKKDEAKHKDTDSTSSKKSHSGRGGKHSSSKDGAVSPLKHTLDQTDSPSWRRWKEPRLAASSRPTSTESHMPSLPKDATDMDEQLSFISPPTVTSIPHKISGECQRSMSIDSIPSVVSFDMQPYPSFSYHGPMGAGPGSTPTLSLSGSSSGFCLPKDKSSHLPSITHLS